MLVSLVGGYPLQLFVYLESWRLGETGESWRTGRVDFVELSEN